MGGAHALFIEGLGLVQELPSHRQVLLVHRHQLLVLEHFEVGLGHIPHQGLLHGGELFLGNRQGLFAPVHLGRCLAEIKEVL
jgi:hypothetical protein